MADDEEENKEISKKICLTYTSVCEDAYSAMLQGKIASFFLASEVT